MVVTTNLTLIHANFFFVDVVGLSDPTMSTKTQIKKIEVLNKSISECDTYKITPKEMMMVLPTGDGMAVGFLQGAELPLQLAIELHKKIAEYNKARIPSEIIQVRIGLHAGSIFVVNDIQGNKNIWGPGIIMARRVMDFGDAGHILLSPTLAEDLRQLSDQYMQIIKPIREVAIKHGQTILLYSAFGNDFGNPKDITRGIYPSAAPKTDEEAGTVKGTQLYSFVEVNLTVKDPNTMLIHHKRTYEIKNMTDKPINHVVHGIATDVQKKSLDDLKVKVYDENNRDLKISSIKIDELYQKEFTTEFNDPILKDQTGRYYIIEYEVEEPERYYENAFLIDCKKLVLKMEYPKNCQIKEPVLYDINQETEEKTKSKVIPMIRDAGETMIIRWIKNETGKGQTFRIEW